MREEFVFEFEGTSEDGNIYLDDIQKFKMLTSVLPIEETGISFSGEIKVDEMTSVIVDKQIKLENPEIAAKTYLKVMEMRDLSEAEIKQISKFKLFFNKLFQVFFKNQKTRVYLTFIWIAFLAFEISTEHYFSCLVYILAINLYNSPIKFAKEIKKMFGSNGRKKELEEELSDKNLMGLVYSVTDDDGIQLYFKPKSHSM